MLTDEQIAEIWAKAEEIQAGGSKWTAGGVIIKLCERIDSLKSALQGIESVRQMQVRNIETLTDERDELKLALMIMLASHGDWVNINRAEKDYFLKRCKLHRETSGSRVTYSITCIEGDEK